MTINEGIEIARQMGISIKPKEIISAKEKIIREREGKPWGKEDFLSAMKDAAVEFLCKNCEPELEQTVNKLDLELISLAEKTKIEPTPPETDSEIDDFFMRCEGKLTPKKLSQKKIFYVEPENRETMSKISLKIIKERDENDSLISFALAKKLAEMECYIFNGRIWQIVVTNETAKNRVAESKIEISCIRGTDEERLIQKKGKTA